MASFPDTLTPLQRAVLDSLRDGPAFFLSGGAALATAYLGHRRSLDLDLFVADPASVEAVGAHLEHAGIPRGWTVEVVRLYPGFRRYSVRRGDEATLVDIVHDAAEQLVAIPAKPVHDGIRFDAMDDLVANKLCAVLGRGDVKDLVDLYFLARSGVDVLDWLPAARRKDAGMEPSTLAWVLRTMPVDPEQLLLVHPVTVAELAAFRDELVARLAVLAWPRT